MRRAPGFAVVVVVLAALLAGACAASSPDSGSDAGPDLRDAAPEAAADVTPTDGDPDLPADTAHPKTPGVEPPPPPPDHLGFEPPAREPVGDPPTAAEITAFTATLLHFFEQTAFYDWTFRLTHGLDASFDPGAMDYRLWWQDTGMRRDGDVLTLDHHGRAENILKRTVKVLDGAAAGHLLTGDARMGQVAAHLMRGVVALSLGFEVTGEDPPVKYLQARAVFNHDHAYQVDGRKVAVLYSPMFVPSSKWNVHVFEVDNPAYGDVWVANMRSKDDVPYLYHALGLATRVYHEAADPDLRRSAGLFLEYVRGFAQSIEDHDWHILTRYADGAATPQVDTTKPGNPPADLGSFVHWRDLFGPDVECTAQLGAALTGYGWRADRGDCGGGLIGLAFERSAGAGNWFNYNIYNYFHLGALSAATLWHDTDLARALMTGLVTRFDELLWDPDLPNADHEEFASDKAGWLLAAAAEGYPLTAREARHVMTWYATAADWYGSWPHWDPWSSLADGEQLEAWDPPRSKPVTDATGATTSVPQVRLDEMGYVFEYCASPYRAANGVAFVDCDLVADPSRW